MLTGAANYLTHKGNFLSLLVKGLFSVLWISSVDGRSRSNKIPDVEYKRICVNIFKNTEKVISGIHISGTTYDKPLRMKMSTVVVDGFGYTMPKSCRNQSILCIKNIINKKFDNGCSRTQCGKDYKAWNEAKKAYKDEP